MVVMAAASMQNTRLLRFLIILGAVVVTIFIYASYSTSTSLAPPLHMRGSDYAISLQQQQLIPAAKNKSPSVSDATAAIRTVVNVSGSVSPQNHLNKVVLDQKKVRHHYREPTIDKDADVYAAGDDSLDATVGIDNGMDDVQDEIVLERLDHNDLLEQYGQINYNENTLDNTNRSVTTGNVVAPQIHSQPSLVNDERQRDIVQQQQDKEQQQRIRSLTVDNNSLNKIPDSEVLIPTSNLQKFIENADTILKNITVSADINKITDKEIILNESDEKISQPTQLASDLEKVQKDKLNTAISGGGVENIGIIESDKELPSTAQKPIKKTVVQISPTTVKQAAKAPAPSQNDNNAKTVSVNKNNTTPRIIYSSQGIPTDKIYEHGHLNYEINTNKICPNHGADLKLLILITSAQDHMLARLAIRQTWGHFGIRRDVSTAFVVGRTTNDTVNKALTQENYIYGDLIRGNFIDSYNNLTLKTISALEWIDENCERAAYILKTDDDMFINVPKLLAFLDSHAKEKRVIFGRLAKKWKPVRNKKSKYYVSPEQFSAAVFPSFTTGPAYLLTGDVVHDLYVRSLQTVYLKLEDVFTTGIVAQQLGVRRLHGNEFLNRRIAFNPCNIRKAISIHMIKANEQFDLWKKLLDQTAKCK